MRWRNCRRDEKDRNEGRWRALQENWPIDSPIKPSKLLHMCAPVIEAAGSIQEALQTGMLKGSPRVIQLIIEHTPQSRGGSLDHPSAEIEWKIVLAESIRAHGIDMQIMRNRAKELRKESNQ